VYNFFKYVYCFSLQVSGKYVSIIRRKYLTYATPGVSNLYRVTNTRCRISTVFSPDNGHKVAETCREKQ